MQQKKLTIGLFAPGMTHLHRVGLAGLYMTLKALDPSQYEKWGGWELSAHSVTLHWQDKPRDLLAPIIEKAFAISKEGIIEFGAHKNHSIGDKERFLLHDALMLTYLQFGRHRTLNKQESSVTFEFEDKSIHHSFKAVTGYKHQELKNLFDAKGNFKQDKNLQIIGWLFPGGGVRHSAYSNPTCLIGQIEQFFALLFAPIASLYFKIVHKNPDGKYDKRKLVALVLPHIHDLEEYHHCYTQYLQSPVQERFADSIGDAALASLTKLQLQSAGGMLKEFAIRSCSVVTMGTVGWSEKQKTRTGSLHIDEIDGGKLELFNFAWKILANKPYINEKKQRYFVRTNLIRGLIADNIALGRNWYFNFHQLMVSQKQARSVSFQRKELYEMLQKEVTWNYEEDKLMVEAVHKSLHHRYGALAARAAKAGEKPRFDREFERIRTSLMRAKNAQTLRAELADLFARGGINKVLQGSWPKLLQLFTGSDWQRARDLALLALASYSGKGADELETDNEDEDDEE